MKITISFKHLEHTPALDQRIKEKSEKLSKYWGDKAQIKWTCYLEQGQHYAELEVIGPKVDHHAKAHSENMYKTIDLAIEKIEKQLAKSKGKIQNKMHRQGQAPVILDPEVAWIEGQDDIE